MAITMELKRVILRGKTYYFRMPVPKDCIKAIGKTEIVVSLKPKTRWRPRLQSLDWKLS